MSINASNRLPLLDTTWLPNGELVYYKKVDDSHVMRLFDGVGISERLLSGCHVYRRILIFYRGVRGSVNYLCSIRDFIDSSKIFVNAWKDKQRFVSFKDMTVMNESIDQDIDTETQQNI